MGYVYVNIDDAWSVKDGRDNKTQRLVPDPDKFPSGINGVADEVHSMGLKLGIYSTAGINIRFSDVSAYMLTCQRNRDLRRISRESGL